MQSNQKSNQRSHRIKRLLPTNHVVTIRMAIGAALVLGALGGQTLISDGTKNKTFCLWRAWITGSSLTETTVSTQEEPLRFWGESQAEYDDLEHTCPM